MTGKNQAAKLREALPQDYPKISALLERNGLGKKEVWEWAHLLEMNPARTAFATNPPLGWVLEDAQGELGGFLANVPALYFFQGKQLKASIACNWAVDQTHRSSSMSLLSRFFSQKNSELFLTTTARQESGPAFTLFKAKRVPCEWYDEPYFRITNHLGFSKSLLLKKEVPLRSLLKFPLASASSLISVIQNRSRKMAPTNKISHASSFDARFDKFWDSLVSAKRETLLALRDAQTLNWHYGPALKAGTATILTSERNQRIIGFAVLIRQDNEDLKLDRMRLADLHVLENDLNVAEDLVAAAVLESKKCGAAMLEVLGFDHGKRNIFERFGFYKRKLEAWPFYYKVPEIELAQALSTDSVWDPSLYDGDGSL